MVSGSSEVREFYSIFPYPSVGLLGEYNIERHANKVLKATGLKAGDFSDKKVLEIGCGTGEIGISLAFNGANVTGVDFCSASIVRAKKLAAEHDLENIEFIETDLFELPEKLEGKFELVSLIGVAHHTPHPREAFAVAVSFVKSGGIVLLGLYNTLAREDIAKTQKIIHNSSSDLSGKMDAVEREVFGRKASEVEKIHLADKFCHPLESTHSLKEALAWFGEEGIEFLGCDPRMISGREPEASESVWKKNGRSFFILAGRKRK